MYRIKEIQDKLLHLVGWDQYPDPHQRIEWSLTQSDTGLYFQEAHPLLTLNNLRTIMPPEWVIQYKEWVAVLPYTVGERVRRNDTIYICMIANTGEDPGDDDFNADYEGGSYGTHFWRIYDPLSDYLEKLTRTGITKVVQDFTRKKNLNQESRNFFEYRQIFQGHGRASATAPKNDNIVGIEICNVKSMGVSTQINRVGLQMIGGAGPVKLYLFHSGTVEPVKTFTVNVEAGPGYFQWFDLPDFFLDFRGGGRWYLCYDQGQIPLMMDGINVNRDWSAEPCTTCTGEDLHAWRDLMKYVTFMPFRAVKPAGFDGNPTLWDPAGMVYTNTENYGINMQITVGCDLTDFIVQQRYAFKDAVQLMVGVVALRTLAMNPDVNVSRNQLNVSHLEITYELDGSRDNNRANSIGEQLDQAMKALEIDTKGLDPLCLKCKSTGVKYGSV